MGNRQICSKASVRRGATLSGYALIVGLISIIALFALQDTGGKVDQLFGNVAGELGSVTTSGGSTSPVPSPFASASASPSPSASASASASVSPASFAALNPSDKSPGIVLSNGNLTASLTSGDNNVQGFRADTAISSGKWYWEVTIHGNYAAAGVAQSGWHLGNGTTSNWADYANTANSAYYYNGIIYGLGSHSTSQAFSPNDVLGIAFDADAGEIWFSRNGAWFGNGGGAGNPATGSNPVVTGFSGTWYPHGYLQTCCGSTYTVSMTYNFGATAFAHAAPSGFTAGVH